MEEENWIYLGIFLDDKSKKKLQRKFRLPEGWREYYDHMTVVFNDGTEVAKAVKSINEKNIGDKFKLKVLGAGISDKAYAVKVALPIGVVCANKTAHITLGCSEVGAPVDSNYIENWSTLYNDLYVTGRMKVISPATTFGFDINGVLENANVIS